MAAEVDARLGAGLQEDGQPVAIQLGGDDQAPSEVGPKATKAARCQAFCTKALKYIWDRACDHWFLLSMGFAIGFAAAVPDFGRTGGWVRTEWSIKYGAVIVIFLLSGMSLKTRILATALKRLHLHLYIQVVSLGLTPLVGFGVGSALLMTALSRDLVSGIILCACMPTTVSTNVVFTRDAGGNEAVALINAVVGNIIGVFISPGLLQVFLPSQSSATPALSPPPPSSSLDSSLPSPSFPPLPPSPASSGPTAYTSVLLTLTYTVIIPLIVGQIILLLAAKHVQMLQKYVNFGKVSNVCVLLIIWSTFCNSFYKKVSSDAVSIVVTIVVQLLLFTAFTAFCLGSARAPLLSRLLGTDRSDAVAVTMCGATKTIALGMPILTIMFGGQANAGLLALPLLIYHALQIFIGSSLVKPLRAWVESTPFALQQGEVGGKEAAGPSREDLEGEAGGPAVGAGSWGSAFPQTQASARTTSGVVAPEESSGVKGPELTAVCVHPPASR